MKAEHRKELQTNVLADKLGRVLHNMREGPSRATWVVLSVVVLVVILGLVWYYFWKSKEESTSALWLKWDNISSERELESFADSKDHQGTPQVRLARFQVARLKLQNGTRQLGDAESRDDAFKSIRAAAESYEKLYDESAETPVLQQEALTGAAKAHECLGDLRRAKELYERLADKFPDSTLGENAKKQLARLNDPAHAQDLADLANQYKPLPAPR